MAGLTRRRALGGVAGGLLVGIEVLQVLLAPMMVLLCHARPLVLTNRPLVLPNWLLLLLLYLLLLWLRVRGREHACCTQCRQHER